MKTPKLLAIAAIALLPALTNALDLTGGNNVSGGFSSANGYLNSIPGAYDWASGYGHTVNGNFNNVFGYQNTVLAGNYGSIFINGALNTIGGYGNAVFGNLNQSSNNSQANLITGLSQTVGSASPNTGILCWVGGQNNLVTGGQSLVFGNFLNDGGVGGGVILSDLNPNGVRSATARFTNTVPNRFNAVFNGGYFCRTNDGQGSNPNAGLYVIAGGTQSQTVGAFARVGINTIPTKATLEVVGLVNFDSGANVGQLTTTGANGNVPGGIRSLSVHASAGILAGFFVANSDERIKRVEGRSDAKRDLASLKDIAVTDFNYIDPSNYGTGRQKKVIAQQVEKAYPQAVSRTTDVVPDIYQKAEVRDGWVELATDLKVRDRVRLISKSGAQSIHKVLEVNEGKFRTDFAEDSDMVFVYGREVNDFRVVDYEAIAMLNVSATQELARKVEVKDAEIAKLNARLAALEARDQVREERLARLEAASNGRPAQAVRASLGLKTPNR